MDDKDKMDEIWDFLNTLNRNELNNLKYILENSIDGDIDYFIYRINKHIKERNEIS